MRAAEPASGGAGRGLVQLTRGRLTGLGLAAILAAGFALRAWRLGGVPPGLWVDEAIEGIQGAALRSGVTLPSTTEYPFPRWRAWCAAEAVAIRFGGATVAAIRAPAVVAGMLAIGLAFGLGRALAGPAGGLGAAAFLAGSFWHLWTSRLALPCADVVPETLAIGWLLLRSGPLEWWAGTAAAGIAGVGALGYPGSFVAGPLVLVLLGLRLAAAPAGRRERGAVIAALGVGLAATAGLALVRPEGFARAAAVGATDPAEMARQLGRVLANIVTDAPAGGGYWRNYPSGAVRYAPVELVLLAVGLWSFLGPRRPGAMVTASLAAWAVLSLSPEVVPGGGTHLLHGLPQLAVAAVVAGCGVGWIASRWGRWGAVVVAVGLAVNAGATGWRYFGRFAADPLVASWYDARDTAVAEAVLAAGAGSPVALTGVAAPTGPQVAPIRVGNAAYQVLAPSIDAPPLQFLLLRALSRSLVEPVEARPVRPRLLAIIREPATGAPAWWLYRSASGWRGRPLLALAAGPLPGAVSASSPESPRRR